MRGDFPDELSDVFCTVHDFNSGDIIAFGRMNVRFADNSDRLRVMRYLFSGEFKPDTPEDKATLERTMIAGFSAGAAAHKIEVEYNDETWVLTVKFEAGDAVFPFTGRNDPKRKL